MAAAALDWIHDTSLDQKYADRWNTATKPARAALLKEAGRDPHHRHIAWAFIPQDVRVDVQTIIDRQAKQPTPPAKKIAAKTTLTDRQKWWDRY